MTPEAELTGAIYALRKAIEVFYKDPQNEADFRRWYQEKYGKPYED